MSLTVELVGGPWDGVVRVLHEGAAIRLMGSRPPPHHWTAAVEETTANAPAANVIGEYRLRRSGDRSFMDWYPEEATP